MFFVVCKKHSFTAYFYDQTVYKLAFNIISFSEFMLYIYHICRSLHMTKQMIVWLKEKVAIQLPYEKVRKNICLLIGLLSTNPCFTTWRFYFEEFVFNLKIKQENIYNIIQWSSNYHAYLFICIKFTKSNLLLSLYYFSVQMSLHIGTYIDSILQFFRNFFFPSVNIFIEPMPKQTNSI